VRSRRAIGTGGDFGFTTGPGIRRAREKEITVGGVCRSGEPHGHYAATETTYESKFTSSHIVQIEPGALGSTGDVGGMTDLDGRNRAAFAAGFGEFRYFAVERTSNDPLPVTLAIEPTVGFIDETSAVRLRNCESEPAAHVHRLTFAYDFFDFAQSPRG